MVSHAVLAKKANTVKHSTAATESVAAPGSLRIGEPNDAFEREADCVAETVMSGSTTGQQWSLSRMSIGSRRILQRKKEGSGKVPNGQFDFEMEKDPPSPREIVHITFSPEAKGPETKAIKFVQIVRVADPAGKTIPWGTLKPEEAIKEKLGPQKNEDRVHETRSGDTLASISLQHYGSRENALKIFAANSQILDIPPAVRSPRAAPGHVDIAATSATNVGEPTGEELPQPDVNLPLRTGLRLKIPRAVEAGFMVDIDPKNKKPRQKTSEPSVSPEYPNLAMAPGSISSFSRPALPSPGYNLPTGNQPVKMEDTPGLAFVDGVLEFESAAYSEDQGIFYGAVRWGFRNYPPAFNQASFPDEWFQISPSVSDTLRASITEFNKVYRNKHRVQQGETLASISMAYFGTDSAARAIFETNPGVLTSADPNAPIAGGTELTLPTGWERVKALSTGTSPDITGTSGNVWERAKQLQRSAEGMPPAFIPPIVREVVHSPGQPLDPNTRAFFESRFGHDFRKVRVHTDSKATESAKAVSASAYTLGRDVVFGSGQYSPGTSTGRRLLAHELVHTLQQNESQQPKVVLRQATGGSRKLQILEPPSASLQSLVDAANKLQRYVGSIYSSLAGKTSAQNPVAGALFPEVSKIDGEIGEILRQVLLGLQLGQIPAQQYADAVLGLRSAKKGLDNILIQAGLARPAKGGQSAAQFVDPYGERVDLSDVNRTLGRLLPGVTPGTPVEYGKSELLHK